VRHYTVPPVTATPAVGPRKFDVVRYADHLLTLVCSAAPALLHAEARADVDNVTWLLRPLGASPEADQVVGELPNRNHFRTVLARLGSEYMDGLLYGGHQFVEVEQDGRRFVVTFFISNLARTGFWARVYASPEEKLRVTTEEAESGDG
jgi:hypothetical protein